MKYTELTFVEDIGFYTDELEKIQFYKKDRLYSSLGSHSMYVDSDKLEIGRKKFKKDLLKHYNNLIKQINDNITNT